MGIQIFPQLNFKLPNKRSNNFLEGTTENLAQQSEEKALVPNWLQNFLVYKCISQ